ncbi:MAG: glycosyltransferase family 39 protein [Rubrobacteraceae bacterium]
MDWGAKPLAHRPLLGGVAIVVYLACAKLLAHVLTAGNYGFYRDEFYFVAASKHLDFGYVDFPPLVAVVTALARWMFGDSASALQFFPALASAGVVVLAGLMARELGGGRFAQGIAALATLVAPNILVFGTWLSMDAFDQFNWALASYALILVFKRGRPRLWLLFGLVAGVGLLTKVTILFLGFAVFASLLLTPARRHLLTPWPWLGGAVALVFLLPYLYWQVTNGWPTLEFWGNYGGKLTPNSLGEFLIEQVLTMNPVTLPVWAAGLYYYLFSREGRSYRVFGFVFVILFAIFAFQNAKFYFLTPAYPMLFAAGGLTIERFIRLREWNWLKPAYASLLLAVGVFVAVLSVLPVLPVETVAKTTGLVGGNAGVESEARKTGDLPQTFAFRHGWEDMVETIAGVYDSLPDEERAASCILAGDFGEAGAVDFFGPAYGLPRAISGHNNYYLWGPGSCSGEVVISIGVPLERLEAVFENIEHADTVTCEYCMPIENDLPIYVARNPKIPFEQAWPQFKHYN